MKKVIMAFALIIFSQVSFAGATFSCEGVPPTEAYICDLFVTGGDTVTNVQFSAGGPLGITGQFNNTAVYECFGSNNGFANVTYLLNGLSRSASNSLPCSSGGGGNGGHGGGQTCHRDGIPPAGSPSVCHPN